MHDDALPPIDLEVPLRNVWRRKWAVLAASLLAAVATYGWMRTVPNLYQASAVIKPEVPDAAKAGGGLGALASIGLPVGVSSRTEDIEAMLKSGDLTLRVFRKHDLWPVLLQDDYDPRTKGARPGRLDRLFGTATSGPPTEGDILRAAKDSLKVASDRRTGIITVTFLSRSAEGSARIVGYYLDEAKERLQEEAMRRASANRNFVEGQIGRTFDPLARERLYQLYAQEVEKEMLARNREQFGFVLIDSPKAPDRKSAPRRLAYALGACILAGFAACLVAAMGGAPASASRKGGARDESSGPAR